MAYRFTRVLRVLIILCCVAFSLGGQPQNVKADTGSNWTGAYYANLALQGAPVFTRIDQAVVFNWGPNPPGSGLGSQYWSARWTSVQFFTAGTYRFTITSDDGVRAYVDGQIILDAWRDQAPTTFFVNVQMTTGNHALQIDYYQGVGDASIAVSWQSLLTQSTAWTGQYFNNPNLLGIPVVTRLEPIIDHYWGLGSPDPFVAPDNFSARWTATLPFNAAVYRFTLAGNDGIRLFIDDLLVVNQWRDQPLTAYSIDVPLAQGLHTLRVEYYERTEVAAVRLTYEIAVGPPPYPGTQSDEWYAEYFTNPNLVGIPRLIRLEGRSGINFNIDRGLPTPDFPREFFSVRWTRRVCGFLGRPTLFYLTVDDGARLYVDNTLIIDVWREQSPSTFQQTVDLTAGCHIIRLEYFQARVFALATLTWLPPDGQSPPLYIGAPPPPPSGSGVRAVVSFASVLNVRLGPGTNFGIIDRIVRGTPLTLSQRNFDNTWVRGVTPTGLDGWVSGRYISITFGNVNSLPVAGGPSYQPPPGVPQYTGVRAKVTSNLRLRSGPGTVYPQIYTIEWGSIVDVIGRSGNNQWLQVRYGTLTGWIYAPYVIIVSGSLGSVPVVG